VRGRGKDAHYEPFSRYKGRAEKNWRGNESKAQHALPDDGKRAKGETQRCDAGSNAIPSGSRSGIRLGAPSRIAKPQSALATAPFITRAIEPSTAPVAVMGKRPNAISPRIESMKTAIERKQRKKERRF
jgi:hypothetical protein